jgi:hypothetical protein
MLFHTAETLGRRKRHTCVPHHTAGPNHAFILSEQYCAEPRIDTTLEMLWQHYILLVVAMMLLLVGALAQTCQHMDTPCVDVIGQEHRQPLMQEEKRMWWLT